MSSAYVAQPAMTPLNHVGMLNPAAAGPSAAPHVPRRSAYVTHTIPRHRLGRVYVRLSRPAFRQQSEESAALLCKINSEGSWPLARFLVPIHVHKLMLTLLSLFFRQDYEIIGMSHNSIPAQISLTRPFPPV